MIHYQLIPRPLVAEMLFLGEGAVTYFTPEGEIDYVFNAMTLKAAQSGDGQLDIGPEG